MRLSLLAPAALLMLPLLIPAVVLANTGPDPSLTASSGTYYVTQIGYGSLARVIVHSDGSVTIDDAYIKGLPSAGPDSAVFANDGTMLASNFGDGSISHVDVNSRTILKVQVNNVSLPNIADLAADPNGNFVWGITYGGSGPTAISRIDVGSGATVSMNPDNVAGTGGIAFSDNGARLFVSSHEGYIAELDPRTGHVVRKLMISGSPDGMSYDPSTGFLFASGCSGICEVDTGGNGGSMLKLVKVFNSVDGDGIAADGSGHVYVAESNCGSLCRLDLRTGAALAVASDITSADDVTPLTGAGSASGTACRTLANCFGGTGGAALAATGIGLVLFLGAMGFHTAAVPSGPGPAPGPSGPDTSHLQEEAGEKLLEVGGAGIEAGGAASPPEPSPGAMGEMRQSRDDDDDPPPPPPPPPG